MDITITINFELRDSITDMIWRTPNHNRDKRKDDFHTPQGVKAQIMNDLSPKIKKRFGHNPDIGISDGKIVIKIKILHPGKKTKDTYTTDLYAEWYFDKVMRYILGYMNRNIDYSYIIRLEIMGNTI